LVILKLIGLIKSAATFSEPDRPLIRSWDYVPGDGFYSSLFSTPEPGCSSLCASFSAASFGNRFDYDGFCSMFVSKRVKFDFRGFWHFWRVCFAMGALPISMGLQPKKWAKSCLPH
jgi:hypothetical protein